MASRTATEDYDSSESIFSFMKGNILVMTVTRIFGMFARSAAFPYFSLYILVLGGNPQSIGFINSLKPLASLLIFPLAGYLADRTGRVKLIVVAGFLSASTYLLYVFAGDWVMLAIGNFLIGVIVFQFPAQSALIADSLSPRQRGIGFATSTAIPGAVAVLAPYFAGFLVDKLGDELGVRYLYALLFGAYLLSALIQMKFLQDTVDRSTSKLGLNLKELVRESYRSVLDVFKWVPTSLKALAVVTALSFMANAVAGPFWVVFAVQEIGISATEWGAIVMIYSAFRIAVSIPAGALIDRFGKRKIIVASFILSTIPLIFFTRSKGFIHVLATLVTLSIGNAFLPPACSALMADVTPREIRGKVMAAFGRGGLMINPGTGGGGGPGMGYAFSIPVMLGSLIGGYVYSLQPALPWILQAVLTVGSLLLSIVFIHEPEKAEI